MKSRCSIYKSADDWGGWAGGAQHFSLEFSFIETIISFGDFVTYSIFTPLFSYESPLFKVKHGRFMWQRLVHQSIFSCPLILSILTQ